MNDGQRRANRDEAFAFARRADQRVGHEHRREHTTHRTRRTHAFTIVVPGRVYVYTLRLRLWASDVHAGVRP